jgi:tetratricopeptide (TPR) repeat protein
VQKLGKPWYRRRALRVFRDDTSLSATPNLWPTIERALDESRYLILLASPEAAASPWVNKEVAWWLDRRRADTLLIAVTDGTLVWDNALSDFTWREGVPLPPALRGRFATEPKWVDLTAYRDGADIRDAKFTDLAADFAATVHGIPKEDLLSQEVRQQRRALSLAWSAASSLLILALAATGAGFLAYRAQRQATANFELAHRTADTLVVDIAQGLRNVTGMPSNTVRQILETARTTFEKLSASAPDDRALQYSKARMLSEFGNTYLTMGDLDTSFEAYQSALAIIQRLSAADPTNMQWQRDVSVSYIKIGAVLEKRGKPEEALKAYRDGLDITEHLAAANSGDTEWLRDLDTIHARIGDVLMTQGDLAGARRHHNLRTNYLKSIRGIDPHNKAWLLQLPSFVSQVGDSSVRYGMVDQALTLYRENLTFAEQLAASDPSNADWQRNLSISYIQIGDMLEKQGKLEEALKAYRDGLAISEHLAATDRSNTEWQRDVSVSYIKIGAMLDVNRRSIGTPDRHSKGTPLSGVFGR